MPSFQTLTAGDEELLIEVVTSPGSEQASPIGKATSSALDNLEQIESKILKIGGRLADTVSKLKSKAGDPAEVSVQFGVRLTASGSVLVSSATGECSFLIQMKYRRDDQHQ